MLERRTVFEIHRLADQGLSARRIANKLRLDRTTVRNYLAVPERKRQSAPRSSKLDPYRDTIKTLLTNDPDLSAQIILQRISAIGYDGKVSIVKDYLRELRGTRRDRTPFVRFEHEPGVLIQVDWAHLPPIVYGTTKRRLYALLMVEDYSRMLYVRFTHSQKQEALHRALLHGFRYFGGTSRKILVDNMLTAVTERHEGLVRFNAHFLDFLRPLHIVPVACNPSSPWEKGKVERSVAYLKTNFLPGRSLTSLDQVQTEALDWLINVANVRVHATTGDRPIDRFAKVVLNPLPDQLPCACETTLALVHRDFAVAFDGNSYTVPPWTVGKKLLVKADDHTLRIFHKERVVAQHGRCYERYKRIEHEAHRELVKKLSRHLWHDQLISVFASYGEVARSYLTTLARENLPIKHQVKKLLTVADHYGINSLLIGIARAMAAKVYTADYIENILYQEMTPVVMHPSITLANTRASELRLPLPLLEEYDALIRQRRNHEP